MTAVKLCKDCKWYSLEYTTGLIMERHVCVYTYKDIVTGAEYEYIDCHDSRKSLIECGPEGKYWEEKK